MSRLNLCYNRIPGYCVKDRLKGGNSRGHEINQEVTIVTQAREGVDLDAWEEVVRFWIYIEG